MHIAPTITSIKPTYDIPILVLAFSDAEGTIHSRKFVALPSHYQELVITARRIFGIKDDATLVFGTSTLDVCRGAWIEIEESAYELLLECLDEVIVRPGAPREDVGGDAAVVTVNLKAREANPIHKNVSNVVPKGRLESQPGVSALVVGGSSTIAPSEPARNEARAVPTDTTRPPSSPSRPKSNFTPNPEPVPYVAPKSTKSRLLTQLDALSEAKSKPLSNLCQGTLEPRPEPEREPEAQEKPKPKFRPVYAARINKIQPESEPLLVPEPPSARQRNIKRESEPKLAQDEEESDKEGGEDHEPSSDAKNAEVLDTVRKKDGVEDEEDDDFWRFGTKNLGPKTTSSRSQQESVLPPTNPSSNSKLTRKGTMIDVEVKTELEEKRRKIRNARARLSTINATQLPRASARALGHFHQDPDMRFMLTVHGPRTGQGADFRTRGGHKIKKVLESACKTFELPFERSRLILEDDSRELKQYYCDPEDTVGSCGIDTNSQLFVQVDGITGQDSNMYDEEEEDEDR